MYIISKIDLVCAENGKVQPYNGKVKGLILTSTFPFSVAVNWQYTKEDGTPLMSGTKYLTEEEADALFGTPLTSIAVAKQVFYGAMMYEMAEAFGCDITDLELVNV